jgi:hypothetical protein
VEVGMGKAAITLIQEGLQVFADRRVLRNFTEKKGKDGKIKFSFLYFGDSTVNLEFTEKDQTLVIRNMLPRVPAAMYSDLQAFLEQLSDPALPAHRRIDRSSADVCFVKKGGNVSLVFKVKGNRYKYGTDKLIELASWVRTYLQGGHQEYLWRVMGEPED